MREKLLILDDERLILTSLEDLLGDDYEVLSATSASTALGLARDHNIAVILCDTLIPRLEGVQFLRTVREISNATRVMMSEHADIAALTEALNNGQIFAYVTKPWDPAELKAQVSAAADHFRLIQEIDQERALLRALMENIPDLIYFKDCQSRFTRVNQAHARHLGARDASECMGKSNANYLDDAYALRSRQDDKAIIRSGRPQIDRIENLDNPRGSHRWWSTTQVPMFDRSGQVTGIAGISRDITALKKSEELLREQNEHNRMILETAQDAFIGMDAEGVITAWNPQAECIFGWTAAEIKGQRLCDAVIPLAYRKDHEYGLEHFLTNVQRSPLGKEIEMVCLHRDGHEFPVEAMVWPVRAGGVSSFNAFVRDVSERRRTEEARKKETTLIQLLQSLTVAANRSSDIRHTAHTCLSLICAYTGWPVGHVYLREDASSEDLTSAGWHAEEAGRFEPFRKASDRHRFAPESGLPARVLASGKPEWIVDLATEESSSERIQAAVETGLRSGFGFPVVVAGHIIGVLEFFSFQAVEPDQDLLTVMGHIGLQLGQVIIRQRSEANLLQAKHSAESANRAKSEFLTTMSHEMRTPMNAILGMADLLAETTLEDQQRDYVRIFQNAGASLLELINNILDLSKVESGNVKLEMIEFDLAVLLERILEMMMPRARDRGLRLTLDLMPGVPTQLVGDSNRLRQVLTNLIGNALKFTERGSVRLLVELDSEVTVRFSVVDTGIGIAPDHTTMIFDRFTQADSSTTRKYGGTGLGLAISAGLVELMGGRIRCTSTLGEGSMFEVTVPFLLRQETDAAELPVSSGVSVEASPKIANPGRTSHILIAEDSEYNLVLTKAYLKDSGFVLDVAENGQVAVERVMANRPDLVLMDLQMPVMDGLEATRAIRNWEAETHAHPVPILALTAHASGEDVGKSVEAGCTEHLTKPIKKAILLEAISRNLNSKILVTPPSDVEGLVPNYLVSVRLDMAKILAAVKSKDCAVARRLGHQFKGTGEGYGFPEITRAGSAVELAAIAANEDEIRNQILSLATYLDRVEIAV